MQELTQQTVTYGTKCTPFLALRTLIHLSEDKQNRFPLGIKTIVENSYVNDFLAGGNDLSSTHKVKIKLQIFQKLVVEKITPVVERSIVFTQTQDYSERDEFHANK